MANVAEGHPSPLDDAVAGDDRITENQSDHGESIAGDVQATGKMGSCEELITDDSRSPNAEIRKEESAGSGGPEDGNDEVACVEYSQTQAEGVKDTHEEDNPTETSSLSGSDIEEIESLTPPADTESAVAPPSLTDAEILRRMEVPLLPDQPGVAPFSVRKSNFKRMKLLNSQVPGSGDLLPYQYYSRNEVLQEIQKLGKDSDWTEHKTVLRVCPLDNILLVRDVEGLYGGNYVWIFTEIAHEAVTAHIEEMRQEVIREHLRNNAREERKKRLKQQRFERRSAPPMCFFAKKWKSDTEPITQAQIRELSLQARRPLITRLISKDCRLLNQPIKFQLFSDKIHSQRPQKNNVFVPLKKEVDFGVQAVASVENVEAQTILCIPKNACTQHDDSEMWIVKIVRPKQQPVLYLSSRNSRYTMKLLLRLLLQAQSTIVEQECKAFSKFFSRVEGLMEEALEHNETTNVFVDSFSQLETGAFPCFQDSREGIREVLSFNDLNFSKSKIVSAIRWLPKEESVICYACVENATFDERIERSGRPVQANLLVWHFEDIITPQAIFSCPEDPIAFEFCEVKGEQYVVAGLITGQLCLWKVPPLRHLQAGGQGLAEAQWSKPVAAAGFVGLLFGGRDITMDGGLGIVLLRERWGVTYNTGRTVSHISVLPQGTDLRKTPKVAAHSPRGPVSTYVVSCAGDDQILVWDTTAAVHSSEAEDYQWRPILQIPIRRHHEAGAADVGCCQIIIQKKDAATTKTCFWASTEEGEVIRGDWACSTEDERTERIQEMYTETRCCRPSHSFEVSPFYQDIALIVMDLGFHIWSLESSKPIYSSPTPAVFYSCGTWSSTRPAVFYIGRVDGTLEVWDLSEQSRACSVAFVVAATAVTCLAFPPLHPSGQHVPQQQAAKKPIFPGVDEKRDTEEWTRKNSEASSGLLAVGDGSGVVHIVSLPKNLTDAVHGEYGMIKTLFAREKDVVSYVTERREMLRKDREREHRKKSSILVEGSDDDHVQPPAPTTEEAELAAVEQEYRILETAYRKDLHLAECENMVSVGRRISEAQRRARRRVSTGG